MIRRLARRALKIGAASSIAVLLSFAAAAAWIAWPIPASVLARQGADGLSIEERHGLVLRSTRAADGSQLRWLAFSELDPDLINAFVAVEDRRFWIHHGVDMRAVARAARDDWYARRVVSGASTISMQLARLLSPAARSWGGKVTQTLWALRLEAHLDKQEILEQYLNRVHLGQATVGVGAASALYFDAPATDVSIAQAATLAGLAHAPSRDNPYASARRARARRLHALRSMRRLGYARREDVTRAADEPLIAPRRTPPFLAPHFTTHVLAWAASDSGGGRSVRTSLDIELQSAIEAEVRHTVDVLHARGVEQAAAVVLDNETGEVLAWVGSPDFWAFGDGQTDMVTSARQPGSALKPFLYALALERGFTAASVLPDIPRAYPTATGPYTPRNYDRHFRGPVRAREALASSYNVPAVELAARVGAGNLLHTLHLAGFASLERDAEHYGLGLALGNGDVTLIELANGYRALANGGEWRPWSWRPARDLPGTLSHGAESRRVVSPVASAIVLDVLSDPAARIPGFGASTPFDFPFPVAVKTGTSRHFTDNWAVGTTRRFTVAVWAGNFNGRPMQGVSGVTGAGPLLHRAVMAVARRIPPGALATPAEMGAVSMPVCRLSGLRAAGNCARLTEWFVPGTAPSRDDDWEHDGRVTLPEEYASWASQEMGSAMEGVSLASVRQGTRAAYDAAARRAAAEESDSARARLAARFRVVSPMDGDRYAVPSGIDAHYATISLRTGGRAEHVRWFVDGEAFSGARWPLVPGTHRFRAVSENGEVAEARIVVER
jgi:penicillin-binding protein 1C